MTDVNGTLIKHDDVLFDGEIHWRYCISPENGTYLLSCEKGYDHNVTQERFSKLTYIGTFEGNEELFHCD